MDLEGVVALIALLLHWRVALCLLATSILAFFLVSVFPWLTGLQGIFLAALGLLPGALWEASAVNAKRPAPPATPETSWLVAGLTSALAGIVWGAVSGSSMHSFVAGAAIFLVAAKLWADFARLQLHWGNTGRIGYCIFLAAVFFPVGALVGHHTIYR